MNKTALAALRASRAEKYAALLALLTGPDGQPKEAMSPEELASFDAIEGEVQAIDARIGTGQAIVDRVAALGVPADAAADETDPDARTAGGLSWPKQQARGRARVEPAVADSREKEPGIHFGRFARLMAASKGIPIVAAIQAVEWWGEDLGGRYAAALQSNSGPAGGFLVPVEFSNDLIALLRNRTIMRKAGVMVVPMHNGAMQMPKQTGGVAGSYIGEGQNVVKSEPTFGQHTMVSKKLSVLVPISNDLIRATGPGSLAADIIVRNDVVTGLAVTEDLYFIRGDGVGPNPKGMRYWADPANVSPITGATLGAVEADSTALVSALENNNVPMTRPFWVMPPRSRHYLMDLRDANGNLRFPTVETANTWRGYPILSTNQIPTNLGAGTESELYFADFDQFVIGEEMGLALDMSQEAAYYDGANLQAAFSLDQTVIRAIAKHDFMSRYQRAIAVKTAVTW